MVTRCTTRYNINKFWVPPSQCICVLYCSQNKHRLFLYTLVFITKVRVYCAVRTEYLNITRVNFILQRLTTYRSKVELNLTALFRRITSNVEHKSTRYLNHLNAELNPIWHLLALLGAHHILRVSRIRVKLCFMSPTPNSCHLVDGLWTLRIENFLAELIWKRIPKFTRQLGPQNSPKYRTCLLRQATALHPLRHQELIRRNGSSSKGELNGKRKV